MQHFKLTHRLLSTIVVLVMLILTACNPSQSNVTTPKMAVIGILNNTPALATIPENFKAGMTELGYVEGKNVRYEDKGIITDLEALGAEAKRLMDMKVDVIFANGIASAQVAKKVTEGSSIPVVFAPGGDPVKLGLVTSIANPGANLTGIATGVVYPSRGLEYLKQIVPGMKRLLLVYNPVGVAVPFLPPVKETAAKLDIELVSQEIHNEAEAKAIFDNMPSDIDGIFNFPDTFVDLQQLINIAIERKLPLLTFQKAHVEMGALVAYGWDYTALAKQTARLVDRVLKGAPVSSLPVETVEFQLIINLKTADAIGITVPDDILQQATTIIRQ